MRPITLLLVAMSIAAPVLGQQPQSSSDPPKTESTASPSQDVPLALPVSLDKIKEALAEGTPQPLRGLNDRPHFKLEVRERQKISIEDLIAAMDFRSGPAAPGGAYGYEQNRLAFPSVDNPLQQPYAAFSQAELLTIVIQNLAVKYLAGKALNAVTSAQRASAEQAARDEVRRAITDYCGAQPNGGAGIHLCTSPPTIP